MKLALVAELLVLGVFVMNLADQDSDNVAVVCDQVLQADNQVCSLLEPPLYENRGKILPSIRTYLEKLDSLVKRLHANAQEVQETPSCKELIDDKPTGSKYMTITFDFYRLMEGFNWTETEMGEYLDLRRSTMDMWKTVDKMIDE